MRLNKDLPALKLITIRIPPEHIDLIHNRSEELGITTSEVIRRCIELGVKKIK